MSNFEDERDFEEELSNARLTDEAIEATQFQPDSRSEAHALATDIAAALMTERAVTEVRGPDRIVTKPDAWSVLAVINGTEVWVDVHARP